MKQFFSRQKKKKVVFCFIMGTTCSSSRSPDSTEVTIRCIFRMLVFGHRDEGFISCNPDFVSFNESHQYLECGFQELTQRLLKRRTLQLGNLASIYGWDFKYAQWNRGKRLRLEAEDQTTIKDSWVQNGKAGDLVVFLAVKEVTANPHPPLPQKFFW